MSWLKDPIVIINKSIVEAARTHWTEGEVEMFMKGRYPGLIQGFAIRQLRDLVQAGFIEGWVMVCDNPMNEVVARRVV